ncbi:MAG TPA: ATP-grasp domain-containing protein [Casimicrobiaceae bacterium]|jgi:predicted ATP-grasp superfamily ATP-dependent carboligase|nr:ATP-grasp domain-containing protein [Casimicrobiaceae bacterium]
MATSALLISTVPRWIGTARIPERLVKAGFSVSMLTPKNTLAEASRFVSAVRHLPDAATTLQWLNAFTAAVDSFTPQLVISCDDMAQRLLQTLVLTPPPGMHPTVHLKLARLIRESIGDPEHYRTSIDKALLAAAGQKLGIRVPPFIAVTDPLEAEAFAAAHNFDVVLKRTFSSTGARVAMANTRTGFIEAYTRLSGKTDLNLEGNGLHILIQARIAGRVRHHAVAAMRGALLASASREQLMANPEPTGPATVTRYVQVPSMREASKRLVEGFGMSGLFEIQFVTDEQTGDCFLLDINRRVTPGTHAAALVGIDLAAAFHAGFHRKPFSARTDLDPRDEGRTFAHFPQEWLRDPGSRYLREYPVDAPWDDPKLFAAMLALRDR